MLLPWKKKLSGGSGGGGRFARVVADLQQPPKHGGALVVQSDFPSSFIDIFIKNKDRVKETAKNRRKREKQQRQQVPDVVASPETVPAPEEANRDSPQQAPNSSSSEEGEVRADSGSFEPSSEESDIPDLDGASRSRFLEIAVVAILGLLALFTKWLVIGATIAALSLAFVEFVGECVSSRPSGGKMATLEASGAVIEVSRSLDTDSDHHLKSDSSNSEPDSEEIKICESNSENAAALEESSALNAEEDDAVVGESRENQNRRRRKLKAKIIKRVVPKKIRSHMKELGHELHRR